MEKSQKKRCSNCGCKLHKHTSYHRFVKDIKGRKKQYTVKRLRCPKCGKTYSQKLSVVNKYDRYSKAAKRKIIDERIRHRQSLYELRDKFATKLAERRPISTISYWTQEAGKIAARKIKEIKVVFSGELIIDEIHVRVARAWRKIIVAIDAVTRLIVAFDLLPEEKCAEFDGKVRVFLEKVKATVGTVNIVTTDMYRSYWTAITEIFKGAKHQYCVFHTIKLIYKKLEGWYGKKRNWPLKIINFFDEIKHIFHAKTLTTAKKRLEELFYMQSSFVGEKALKIFFFLRGIKDKVLCYLEEKAVAKTSNLIERLFRFFKRNYKQMYHFRTEEACINYVSAWVLYKNSRKYQRGIHKEQSPYELAGVEIKDWINLLF